MWRLLVAGDPTRKVRVPLRFMALCDLLSREFKIILEAKALATKRYQYMHS
jgi:hypothetical protein